MPTEDTLALRPHEKPADADAERMLAGVFGASGVRSTGSLLSAFEARGLLGGAPVRVELMRSQTQRSGTQPFAIIEVEDDLDLTVIHGGALWPYPAWEAHSAFRPPRLATRALAGAPRTLLEAITRGPVADRLAASTLSNLSLGMRAQRDGCATRGVRYVVEGWPLDEATLRYLIDTAIELQREARNSLASCAGRHPEVVADEIARSDSRMRGLKVAGVVLIAILLVSALAVIAVVRSLP